MQLRNRLGKEELLKKLAAEKFKRITVSFYRYVKIENPKALRDQLYRVWYALDVFGRTYLAKEGINAQINVPEHNWDKFVDLLNSFDEFKDMPFKIAVEESGDSFCKLAIKVKDKIVADGLAEDEYDVTNVGTHLSAKEFNEELTKGAIVVDMRNHYESEVGHFEGAICPDADTFREELPMVADELAGKEDQKVLLYCTGGIRCEKASAYLKHKGFKDVNQLHGGIIAYKHQIDEQGLESKFKGKNFVFDGRIAERISDEVISECHQCGSKSDLHTNCENDACHLLFIQCDNCSQQYQGCCSEACMDVIKLPKAKQRELRKLGKALTGDQLAVYKSRIRPKLKA